MRWGKGMGCAWLALAALPWWSQGCKDGVGPDAAAKPKDTIAVALADTATGAALPDSNIDYTIAQWPLFYNAALSLTFDSLPPDTLETIRYILGNRERRIGASFFLAPSALSPSPTAKLAQTLAGLTAWGYEVGALAPADSLTPGRALLSARADVEAAMGGKTCFSVAYPGGLRETAAAGFYRAGRLKGGHRIYADYPTDFLALEDYHFPTLTFGGLDTLLQDLVAHGGWAIVTSDHRTPDFEPTVNNILNYHAHLWDASIHDVVCYIREARSAKLHLVGGDNDSVTFTLADRAAPDSVYRQALSFEIRNPGWDDMEGHQGGQRIWTAVLGSRLRFAAVPDAGPITLVRKIPGAI